MPLFRYRCRDGSHDIVEQEVELAEPGAARIDAVRFAAEMMRDDPAALCGSGQLRVEVIDAQGTLLFSVIALAIEAPAAVPNAVPVFGMRSRA